MFPAIAHSVFENQLKLEPINFYGCPESTNSSPVEECEVEPDLTNVIYLPFYYCMNYCSLNYCKCTFFNAGGFKESMPPQAATVQSLRKNIVFHI